MPEDTMTYSRTTAEVLALVEAFRQDLHDVQRKYDAFVGEYDAIGRIDTKEEWRTMKAYGMIWSAWWDLTDTIAFLRAADRRLRDEDGILADTAKER